MRKRSKIRQKADLEIALRKTDEQLGQLNWELAMELTKLAAQTNDPAPLMQAVDALRSAKRYYSFENMPREHAVIQQSIADTLLKLGRQTGDRDALTSARDAYRGAITLASLLSDDALREDLRNNYKLTQTLLGDRPRSQSLFNVA
ncbi:MAG: hypothetical protein AAGJ85_09215 [Pseudomonadota bacterium]